MLPRVCLFLVLFAAGAVAPPSNPEKEEVMDLQGVLLNASKAYKDLGQGIKDLGSDMAENLRRALDSMNKAQLSDQKLKGVILKVKDNNRRTDAILERLLFAIGSSKDRTTADPSDPSTTSEPATTNITASTITQSSVLSRDCAELYQKGHRSSRSYVVGIPGVNESFSVYCDMETDGGGWTVFQRRGDFGNPEDYFYKYWAEYKNGFGQLDKEFWLGNDLLSAFTELKKQTLRVDLEDLEGDKAHAQYSTFQVNGRSGAYHLFLDGYSGDAGDSLSKNNRMAFSTRDRDNDRSTTHCAQEYQSAWWYNDCSNSHLNGLNLLRSQSGRVGISWYNWKKTYKHLASSEMKIRPSDF